MLIHKKGTVTLFTRTNSWWYIQNPPRSMKLMFIVLMKGSIECMNAYREYPDVKLVSGSSSPSTRRVIAIANTPSVNAMRRSGDIPISRPHLNEERIDFLLSVTV